MAGVGLQVVFRHSKNEINALKNEIDPASFLVSPVVGRWRARHDLQPLMPYPANSVNSANSPRYANRANYTIRVNYANRTNCAS
jgi:hypothetical protein